MRTQLWTWFVISFCAGLTFFGNLRFGSDAIGAGFEDDFYYYAQAARNLAFHGMSTFDGIHRTNGYHPLWFLLLTILFKLFAKGGLLRSSGMTAFLVALETVQFLLVLATAFLVYRVARLRCSHVVSCCAELCAASISLVLVRTGMESGLTLALALVLLLFRLNDNFRWNKRNSLLYGLVASTMVLSRLDSILFVLLLFFFDVLPQTGARAKAGVAWFCVGLLPLAAYLGLNRFFFGTLLPVSGSAKQLRFHHTPSLAALRSFAEQLFAFRAPIYAVCVLVTACALFRLLSRRHSVPAAWWRVLFAAFVFPFVHLFVVICLSDWAIWQWYLYAWPVSATAAVLVLLPQREEPKAAHLHWEYAAFALCCVFTLGYGLSLARTTNPTHHLTYVAGKEIEAFAATHPGVYAMGDRSGAVGYLLPDPVIQLEGLMMDANYLQKIRAQRDLLEVLRDYGVQYYIASRSEPDSHGCYSFREPAQAGADSPAMRGRLCAAPLLVLRHGSFTNQIFDLQPHPAELK